MNPMNEAWNLLKGMKPMDDPRISGYLSRKESLRIPPYYSKRFSPNPKYVKLEQEATRTARPAGGRFDRSDLAQTRTFDRVLAPYNESEKTTVTDDVGFVRNPYRYEDGKMGPDDTPEAQSLAWPELLELLQQGNASDIARNAKVWNGYEWVDR